MYSSNRILIIAVALLLTTHSARLTEGVTIDFDCSKNDLPPGSCFNGEPVPYNDGDALNFVGVSNFDDLLYFKLISTTNLTFIPQEIFSKFPNLIHLNLRIGMHDLSPATFAEAAKIKTLFMKRNYVVVLPHGVFARMPELEEVNMQDNQLSHIDDGAFSGLDKMQTLNLYGNYLTVLRAGTFAGAINLRNLNCGFNAIETIEEGALNLPKLEEILFFNNKIKHLSNTVFVGAPKLLNIDLKQNLLETIGQSFFTLTKLHQLQLSGNDHIADLNILAFSTLPSLSYLGLENLGLRGISSQFTVVDQGPTKSPLTTMSLSHNRLASVDFLNKISIFKKLEKIYVDQNAFVRWNDDDVAEVKKMFPHIELIVTKSNPWDKQWLESTLVPSFRSNRIFCDQFKYLSVYIFNSTDGEAQTTNGSECL